MTLVAVLVPIHAGDEHRRRAFAAITEHYARHHAPWEFIVGEWHEHPWSKGAALGMAFRRCSADILVIADADSIVDPATLELSVQHVAATSQWVVPHSNVYRLNEAETDRYYRTGVWRRSALHLVRTLYTGPAGGGITVLTREAWETVNGIDPRFEGWGGEDIAFGYALETLVGPYQRMAGRLVHFWHPHPAPNLRGSPEAEALVARYTAARSDREAMRSLIAERTTTV